MFIVFCGGVGELIGYKLTKGINEDILKLEIDYKKLVSTYQKDKNRMVIYKEQNGNEITIPVIKLYERKINDFPTPLKYKIEFDEEKPKYILPSILSTYSNEILCAHDKDTYYHNTNIRLNDLIISNEDNNLIGLVYSYTTFFDSLVTNRAMDFQFKKDMTVRDIYEPGPIITDLKYSRLSNHLGFNGFVELKDGNIIFLKRKDDLSVGKNTWQQSIGASFKTKYALNDKHEFTPEGISKAIVGEINDELKLGLPNDLNLKDYVFAFYRDLVEGGKPQFVFYYKIPNDMYVKDINGNNVLDSYKREWFETNFYKHEIKKDRKEKVIDGDEFKFYKIDQLKTFKFTESCMIDSENEKLEMTPSSIASIILLLKNYPN